MRRSRARRVARSGYNLRMKPDPVVSLQIINNERLRRAAGWADYRDLGGALSLTSDAPLPDLNCIESFTADARTVESLLDVGFALLRAFDREPAVKLTPLDRPRDLAQRLQRRRMVVIEESVSMVHRGDTPSAALGGDVGVRVAAPEDAQAFADLASAGGPKWMRALMRSTTLASVNEPGHTFYIGNAGGEPAGTLHMLEDGSTAGLYAISTLKPHRGHGVATALIARAIADARSHTCEIICLRTAAAGDAHRLFESLGFEEAHRSMLWEQRPG